MLRHPGYTRERIAQVGDRIRALIHADAVAPDRLEVAGPVVAVATDAPVTFSTATDALPLAAADPARVAQLATQLGVGSSIARLQKALDALPAS